MSKRLIDANELISAMYYYEHNEGRLTAYDVQDIINKAPTIDAVSVVRCKECRWSKANGTYQWCGRLDSTARITADDFCSYGEREDE